MASHWSPPAICAAPVNVLCVSRSARKPAAASPLASPANVPPPSLKIESLSSRMSVSARRMFATAKPDGKLSRMRSTRIGV